jgi:choline dehydrogenase-like flavoprotein
LFIDGRSVPDRKVIHTDICIVGAGPAGITLSREFAGQPFRVCLLESGNLEFDAGAAALADGENVGLPYWPLRFARLRYFGGTSNHWGGWSTTLDEIDFETRDWVPNSGWPFGKAHLDPYYERAQSICRLGPARYDAEFWRDPAFWPDGRDRPALPLRADRVVTRIFQIRALRFGEAYRDALAQASNIDVYLNANVVEIQTTKDARTVIRVAVVCLQGPRFFVAARMFILAVGGIETARLLLLSNGVQPAGLGNQHDLVGRFFMEHPYLESGFFLPSQLAGVGDLYKRGATVNGGPYIVGVLKVSPELQRREKLLNHCFVFMRKVDDELERNEGVESLRHLGRALRRGQQPTEFWKHLGNVLADIDDAARAVYRTVIERKPLAQTVFTFLAQFEQVPNPDSRVTLSAERDALGAPRVRLDWRLTPADKRSVRRAQEILGEEMGRMGLARVRVALDDDDTSWSTPPKDSAPWTGPRGGFHHMGTTRMHADPRKGVVDRDCRVHGMSNLFIASSSVFPTGGFSNPTLTIIALALRLADHLKRVLK